jgi:hypothetical protein
MIKISILLASILLVGCSNATMCSVNEVKKSVSGNVEQSKGVKNIMSFIGGIKPVLENSMKEDPTGIKASNFCANSAIEMTKGFNSTLPKGESIRRTALKYRNPANKPDKIDIKVMEEFVAYKNFDKPKVIMVHGVERKYKALPTKDECMICHGGNISPAVKKVILKSYPKDLATGFKLGDFRGVVVSEIKR